MILFTILKKKIFLFIFVSLSFLILVTLPCNLLLARTLRPRKKNFKKKFTQHLQVKKKDAPKIEQRDKKNYEWMPFSFKEHRLRIKSRPGITNINNISKNNDQKSPLEIKPLNLLNNLKKKMKRGNLPRIKDAVPDHNPSVTKDEEGNIYLVWEHGNELWWAINKGNDWKINGKLTKDGGENPVVIYEPGLSDYGTSKSLVCIWESLNSPHTIMKSVGKIMVEGITWSKPQPVTSDSHNDYGIAMVMDNNRNPLVLWLQSDGAEDDSDLYYQVISMNTLQPAWTWEDVSSHCNECLCSFNNASCIERRLASGGSLMPRFIPIFGGIWGYDLVGSMCVDFTELPPLAPSLPCYDPNEPLYPLFLSDLSLTISLGRRINVTNIVFALAEAVLEKDANDQYIMTEKACSFGGDIFIDLVSLPIPLFICCLPIGRTRLGVTLNVGADITFVDYIDQYEDSNSNALLQMEPSKDPQHTELIDQNFPVSIGDIDFSQIDEVIFLFEIAMGAGGGFQAFGGLLQGEILALGGITTEQIFPCYPSDYVYEYVRTPFLIIAGLIRCGGPWNGILHVFQRSIGSIDFDPNAYNNLDPNNVFIPKTFRSAGKDRLLERNFSLMKDKVSIYEALESIKKTFQGTGSVYEGKTVLNDISKDLYSDGLPDLAKSDSGEILVAWAKGFASSCLGSKVYVAEYKGDSWNEPIAVTPDIDFNQETAIVFDSHNNPMLVWSSASNEGLDYEQSSVEEILMSMDKTDLMYAQRIKGKWTLPKKVAVLSGKDGQVHIASGPQGEITAVWINQTERLSTVYSSFWNGKGWSEPYLISKDSLAESPQVIYRAGKPMVVWAQDEDGNQYTFDDWSLYFSLWDGSSWSSPRSLSFNEKQLSKSLIKKMFHNSN